MTETRITPNEQNVGSQTSAVSADQATASTTYADLATAGPAVTVDIGPSGKALVSIGAGMYTGATGKNVGVAISGATTRAAPDFGNTLRKDDATFTSKSALAYLETGLNPGSTTFTMKYKSLGGTNGNFFDRTLTVVPL